MFIVDDDDAVRDSIRCLLELSEFDVEAYGAIDEFMSRYHRPALGCLILDQHFPGGTGLTLMETEFGRNLGIPVILMTGRGDPALQQLALAKGVTAYLEKPVAGDALLRVVRQLVRVAAPQTR